MPDDTSLHDVLPANSQEEVALRHAAVGQRKGNVCTQYIQVGDSGGQWWRVGGMGKVAGVGGMGKVAAVGGGEGSYCILRT